MVFEERRTTRSGSGRAHRNRNRDKGSEQGRVYQDPHPTSAPDNEPPRTRPSTAQKTLELHNDDGDEYPKLRGGGAFKVKKSILTCPSSYLSYSDEEVAAPRTPVPERIVRATRVKCGRARLPPALRRMHADERQVCQSSNTHQVTPNLRGGASSPSIPPQISPPHSLPTLRGGAGGGDSSIRLPPTLFWLAGGKGKPVSIGGWKKTRGKKRMGGLLGLAAYGARAGKGYGCEDESVGGGSAAVSVRSGLSSSGVSVVAGVGSVGSSSVSVEASFGSVVGSVGREVTDENVGSSSMSMRVSTAGTSASSVRTVVAEQHVASGEGDATPEGPPSEHGEEAVEEQGSAEGVEAGHEEQDGNAGGVRASAEDGGAGGVAPDAPGANAVGEGAARS